MKLLTQKLLLLVTLSLWIFSCLNESDSEVGGGLAGTGTGTAKDIDYVNLEDYSKRIVDEQVNLNDLISYSPSSYQVSDPSIANVSEDGTITFLKEGLVTITLTPDEKVSGKTAGKFFFEDENIPLDTNTTELEFVVKPKEFTFKNWVGELDTLVSFTETAFGLKFVRSLDSLCDWLDFTLCAGVESDIITSQEITDNVTQLGQAGYYGYTYGKNVAAYSLMSAEKFETRSNEAQIVFDNKLFLIGGWTTGDVNNIRYYKNDIWTSEDGGEWIQQKENAEFSERLGHQVVERDGLLWLMGGNNGGTYYNDVWVSDDGINWTEVPQTSSFGIRSSFELFVLNGEFYIAGGYTTNGDSISDLWKSSDGANWTQVDNSFHITGGGDPVVVLNEEGTETAFSLGDSVYSTTDGSIWTQIVETSVFAEYNARNATVLNGEIWLFTHTYENFGADGNRNISRLYTSQDGTNWNLVIAGEYLGDLIAREVKPLAFKDQIFVVGGRSQILEYTNEVWSTSDGENWVEHAMGGFYGPRYKHAMASFNGKLFSVGGQSSDSYADINTPFHNDVWSSQDGLDWQQITANAPEFGKRAGHVLVTLGDRMCFHGGYGRYFWIQKGHISGAKIITDAVNRVRTDGWCTFDGESWHELALRDGDYNYDARSNFASVFFQNRLWVIGGNYVSDHFSDVWRTEPVDDWEDALDQFTYGAFFADFEEVTASAPWGQRTGMAVTVHNGEMYLSGGRDADGFYLDDLWKTSNGISWTLVNADMAGADMPKRAFHQMLSFDGKLWIIGGRANYHETLVFEDTTVFEENDIWMSDDNGVTWTEITDEASFEQRQDFQAVVHNDAMYISGGTGGDGYVSVQGKDSILNDVWRSEDGINWRAGFTKTVEMQR